MLVPRRELRQWACGLTDQLPDQRLGRCGRGGVVLLMFPCHLVEVSRAPFGKETKEIFGLKIRIEWICERSFFSNQNGQIVKSISRISGG